MFRTAGGKEKHEKEEENTTDSERMPIAGFGLRILDSSIFHLPIT